MTNRSIGSRLGPGCILAGLAAGSLAGAEPAAAMIPAVEEQDGTLFAGVEPIANEELGGLRGGFMVAGLEFNFAIEIRTSFQNALNETVGLVTSINFNDAGQTTRSQTIGTLPTGATTIMTGAQGSVQAALNTEATRILHDISPGKLTTIINNSANQMNVSQDMRLDVQAPNFSSFATNFTTAAQLGQLGEVSSRLGLGSR